MWCLHCATYGVCLLTAYDDSWELGRDFNFWLITTNQFSMSPWLTCHVQHVQQLQNHQPDLQTETSFKFVENGSFFILPIHGAPWCRHELNKDHSKTTIQFPISQFELSLELQMSRVKVRWQMMNFHSLLIEDDRLNSILSNAKFFHRD